MVVINTEPPKKDLVTPTEETDTEEDENEALLELGILDKSLLLEDDDDLDMEVQE